MAESKNKLLKEIGKAVAMSLVPGAGIGAGIAELAGLAGRKKWGQAKPVRPKARPEKIEQEAAEAAAVAQGNKEALRRVKEEKAEKNMPVAMKSGGKMPMVKKGDKSVPAFAADGVGKMSYGGKMPKKMNMGGKCRGMGAATRGGNFKMG